eukprot:1177759-Prorocentrum_minimum.AAC.1
MGTNRSRDERIYPRREPIGAGTRGYTHLLARLGEDEASALGLLVLKLELERRQPHLLRVGVRCECLSRTIPHRRLHSASQILGFSDVRIRPEKGALLADGFTSNARRRRQLLFGSDRSEPVHASNQPGSTLLGTWAQRRRAELRGRAGQRLGVQGGCLLGGGGSRGGLDGGLEGVWRELIGQV